LSAGPSVTSQAWAYVRMFIDHPLALIKMILRSRQYSMGGFLLTLA
jgi:hypothetical protein